MDLFSKYYNANQPLKELLINGVKISFSSKTRSFSGLLQKKENKKLKGLLIDVVENFYLNNNIGDSADIDTRIWKILIDNMTSEKRYLINDIFIKLELAKYICKIKNILNKQD